MLLARLIRTQGRHGELLADSLTDFPERFRERPEVWLLPPAPSLAARAVTVERYWPHKGRIVLKFAGVDSMNDAEVLRGWDVVVAREQRMPLAENEFYIGDLIDCHVIDEAAGDADLGPVVDVARGENGSADILIVQQAGDELLIPFVRSYIVALDLPGRRLRMRLPAGLTSLNDPLTDEERARQQTQQED